MSSSIFHDYDIRGYYPGEINETVFYNLGRAIASVLKSKKIALGRDARLSSDTLFLYLAAGLASCKVKIIDLGKISTPMGLWYSQYFKINTLIITASHNPKDQNGLKIFSPKLGAVGKNSGLAKIKNKLDKLSAVSVLPKIIRSVYQKHNPYRGYADFVLSRFNKFSPAKIKIALDFSHGVAGQEFSQIFEKLKINFATLNETPNGNFPLHGPNPLEEASQKQIKVLLKTGKFGLGAVIDGDGDRVLFLDEKGVAVDPAYIFSLMLDFYADPLKQKTAVKSISVAKIVDAVAAAGHIKLVTSKVGRTNIQHAMKKEKAFIGVEKSGHYFFKDFYFGDSGLFALLTVSTIMAKKKKNLSDLLIPYHQYVILPETSLAFEGGVDRIINALKKRYQNGKVSELDGLTVEYPDWRFNLRRSNTENVWRLNLEGKDKNKLETIKKEVESVIAY
ncbi:MAG: hypothetical protein HY452_01685 [Parcubacteria group bacterium]|nr:hypothetical protein [Parcubacteria group bacterium]